MKVSVRALRAAFLTPDAGQRIISRKGASGAERTTSSSMGLFAHDSLHRSDHFGGLIHYFFCERFEFIAVDQLGVKALFFRFCDQLGAGQSFAVTCTKDLHDVG